MKSIVFAIGLIAAQALQLQQPSNVLTEMAQVAHGSDTVERAKLAGVAERYDDMRDFMKSAVGVSSDSSAFVSIIIML